MGPGSNTLAHGALLTYMRQIITHTRYTDTTNPTQLALSSLINGHIPWILQYNGRIFLPQLIYVNNHLNWWESVL
ncbi:hypothetical protein XENTR_v10004986 [Xenopus tropicalis]|nr:hypothetical protein XENTR_v10004986 [Xenopus tropicalis]